MEQDYTNREEGRETAEGGDLPGPFAIIRGPKQARAAGRSYTSGKAKDSKYARGGNYAVRGVSDEAVVAGACSFRRGALRSPEEPFGNQVLIGRSC